MFDHIRLCVCAPIVGVTRFGLCDLVSRCRMFFIKDIFLAIDDFSVFPCTGTRLGRRFVRHTVDQFFFRNDNFADGQRMQLPTNDGSSFADHGHPHVEFRIVRTFQTICSSRVVACQQLNTRSFQKSVFFVLVHREYSYFSSTSRSFDCQFLLSKKPISPAGGYKIC